MKWSIIIRYVSLAIASSALLLIAPVVILARLLPAGEQVAYMYDRGSEEPDWNIYLLDVRHGLSVPFIVGEAQDRYPEWSPDGKWLAYHANPNGYGLSGPFHLYIANASTGNTTLLSVSAESTIAGDNQAMVAWSPDGSRLAFHSGEGYYMNRPYKIFISDTRGKSFYSVPQERMYGEVIYAAWSPHGDSLAFVLSEPQGDGSMLYTIEVGSSMGDPVGKAQQVYRSLDDILFPTWSPDGQQIAFAISRASLQSTPNGSYLQTVTDELFIVNVDGTDLRQITMSSPDTRNMHPDWLPDGRSIIFASGHEESGYDLYKIDVDGTNLTRLTRLPGDEWAPDWKP